MPLHEATAAELDAWDARTVEVPGGHVFQSRTWGEYRTRHGWRPRYLVFDDGFALLAAERPWLGIGGSGAYLARGPVAAGEPAERTADRLRAAADWLAERGADVVSSDAEIPAATGYPALLRARGFHQIEEAQPSRHRMALPLEPGLDEAGLFGTFPASLRQRIRGAERAGLQLQLFDVGPPEAVVADGRFQLQPIAGVPAAELEPIFQRHLDLVAATAARRHFPTPPRAAYIDASSHVVAAGLGFHVEVRAEGELLAAALFYRHGGRITYALSADRVDTRKRYPGVVHLLLWRVIQLAIAEGQTEFDLAGVDILGARHRPEEGDEMYGLYAFKAAFGGQWVELSGNHEWVARPWRYAAGRLTNRLTRLRGRDTR